MRNETAEIQVRGMICRACTESVEEALLQTRGVLSAKVRYYKGLATVEYDPDLVTPELLEQRILSAGYETGDKGLAAWAVDLVCLAFTALIVWFLTVSPLNPVPEATADTSLALLFVIGLLTSTHCIGMCGGILLSTTTGKDLSVRRSAPVLAAVSYNGGRLLSYTAMGAIFGALGTVITYTMSVKSMVFTMIGILVAVIGLNMWGLLPGLRALVPEQNSACALPGSTRKRFAGRPLLIGLLTGLMPCGSLYAMWLVAMASGSAAGGALRMLAFTAGTVPLLVLFGALGAWFPRNWNKYLLKASSVLVTAMGLRMLLMGLQMLHMGSM
ncbi:MAG: sulfite exporter TauE/SafE family protein [Oscillospiraceae bacterium]|nr:sulfite exporter TauE/SafE family protein [Oscillospiraceae bacterium]